MVILFLCQTLWPREKGQSLQREMGESQLITDKVAVLLLPLAAAVMTNVLPEQR